MDKSRIVHVTHLLHPDAGGPPAVAVNLATAQARLGHQVTVVGHYRHLEEATSHAMFSHAPSHLSLKRELLPLKRGFAKILAMGFRQTLRKILPETDILIAHGMWSFETVHGARMARRAGVPYVVRPAGMLDPWSLRQKPLKKMLSLRWIYAATLRNAAFVQATTEQEAQNIRQIMNRFQFTVPIQIIPNGIFLKDIDSQSTRGSFYTDHPELRNRPYVAFLGRLHHKKRADLLVRAFMAIAPRFPQLQLVIAGPDDGEAANLLRLSAELKLTDRIHFTGPIYGAKKFECLADAACFCLPSEQENFGVAVAEAMAAGTPVIVSDQVQIWPEIAQWHAGRVCTLDVKSVADALCEVLQNETARVAMGAAGRELTREKFPWRNIAIRSTEHYAQVLTNRTGQTVNAPPVSCP